VVFVFSYASKFLIVFKLATLVFLAAKRKSPSAAVSRGKKEQIKSIKLYLN